MATFFQRGNIEEIKQKTIITTEIKSAPTLSKHANFENKIKKKNRNIFIINGAGYVYEDKEPILLKVGDEIALYSSKIGKNGYVEVLALRNFSRKFAVSKYGNALNLWINIFSAFVASLFIAWGICAMSDMDYMLCFFVTFSVIFVGAVMNYSYHRNLLRKLEALS